MALSEDDFDMIEGALPPISEDDLDEQEDVPVDLSISKAVTKRRRTTKMKLDFDLLMGEKGFSYLRNNNAQLVNSLKGSSNELYDVKGLSSFSGNGTTCSIPKTLSSTLQRESRGSAAAKMQR